MPNTVNTVALCIWLTFGTAVSLECYNCPYIDSLSKCNTSKICNPAEVCFQDAVISGQTTTVTLGCIDSKQCGSQSSGSGALIGREVSRRQDNRCHECCASDHCNKLLCSQRKASQCLDDETIDCVRMDSVFGICKDIQHAKSLCPKFCRLCDVVDGVWSEWSTWSECDVTCESGTQTRARTCTNPAPAHGGLDCAGNSMETKRCYKELCPVHGQWSEWASWEACSTTCDVGIERRQRSCTNPAPSRFGDHCFGLNVDDRLCMPGACSNGGWSPWQPWDPCSVSCGGGIRLRSRTCSNPTPSPYGHYCVGNPFQIEMCSTEACQATVKNVAFQAHTLTNTAPLNGEKLVFSTTTLDKGSGYNNKSGIYITPVAGIYMFTLQLCITASRFIYFEIDTAEGPIHKGCFNDDASDFSGCQTATTIAELGAKEHVWIKSGSSTSGTDFWKESKVWNSFSGVLISTVT
ncbi:A disintegrin and metalloproteinase with thrombospondin motifs adt-1-like [Mercenaria mercenaria]|uniref:A disintegrin and metalloproteinase with thrombospondin motifs adt-1-like n=1 Tax=Mercenaria mercenaria TaxID=6596 RepID=UPI00234E70D4|nr:A disintegrin and metalloproteinase with thrombospondin motifs adt-1-like [Mercenaria mercenaria]